MAANSLISVNTDLWKKYTKGFFLSMIANIIPASIALGFTTSGVLLKVGVAVLTDVGRLIGAAKAWLDKI